MAEAKTEPQNLVSEITGVLIKHDHPNPMGWHTKVHPDAFNHEDIKIRRFQINQFWRTALSRVDLSSENNTMGERFCLIEDGSINDWLRLFDTEIAPSIIKYQIEFPLH